MLTMLEKDDWKIAVEDARVRHSAVVGLIYFTDSQAVNLLRLYVTIASASAAGAITSFASDVSALPVAVGWGLAVATLAFVTASYFCFLAMTPASINLPGRDAEFWLWAMRPDIERTEVFKAYLANLKEKTEINNSVNLCGSKYLTHAKQMGMAAPLFALVVGVLAAWMA